MNMKQRIHRVTAGSHAPKKEILITELDIVAEHMVSKESPCKGV